MSIDLMARVWRKSEQEGGALLVLLALADHANDDGDAWTKVENLAKKARLSVRQTHRVLKLLVESGEIEVPPGERSKTNPFRVICQYDTCRPRHTEGDAHVRSDVTPTSGPYVEPPGKPPENHQADGALFDAKGVVEEIHELYCQRVPGKERSRLTPEAKKMILKALEERPAAKVKLAIIGLSMSDHHRDGGFTALKYAIGKTKQSETAGDRIDMMASKAPRGADPSANGSPAITVEELLKPFVGYPREKVLSAMADVRRAIVEPSDHNTELAGRAEAWLAQTAKIVKTGVEGNRVLWGPRP